MEAGYVDVRGPWPTLVIGNKAWQLTGADRSITVADAINRVILLGKE